MPYLQEASLSIVSCSHLSVTSIRPYFTPTEQAHIRRPVATEQSTYGKTTPQYKTPDFATVSETHRV